MSTARKSSVPPRQRASLRSNLPIRVSAQYRQLWQELDLNFDRFIRTTEPRHERAVHRMMHLAQDNGYIYKGHYEGQYCVFDEMYVDEPLPGGLCPECKRPTERVREENYYFKLSAFQDRLLELYEKQPDFVQPETRRNEVIAFVRGGLRDLSVSRTSVKWGIPWPGDENHVFYVWYDALTSYMTGVGYGDDEVQWEKYWPADLHLVGKEILAVSCGVLAGVPDGREGAAAQTNLRARLVAVRGRENEQIARQHAVSAADRAHAGHRRAALFSAARNGVRPGRQFQPRFAAHALQQRPREWPRQSGQPHSDHDRTLLRRNHPRRITRTSAADAKNHSELVAKFDRNSLLEILGSYDRYAFSNALERIWDLVSSVDKYLVLEKPWTLAEDAAQRTSPGTSALRRRRGT